MDEGRVMTMRGAEEEEEEWKEMWKRRKQWRGGSKGRSEPGAEMKKKSDSDSVTTLTFDLHLNCLVRGGLGCQPESDFEF